MIFKTGRPEYLKSWFISVVFHCTKFPAISQREIQAGYWTWKNGKWKSKKRKNEKIRGNWQFWRQMYISSRAIKKSWIQWKICSLHYMLFLITLLRKKYLIFFPAWHIFAWRKQLFLFFLSYRLPWQQSSSKITFTFSWFNVIIHTRKLSIKMISLDLNLFREDLNLFTS